MQARTIGGSADTDVNAETVRPDGPSAPSTVTMVTDAASEAIMSVNVRGVIIELSSWLVGSDRTGVRGTHGPRPSPVAVSSST